MKKGLLFLLIFTALALVFISACEKKAVGSGIDVAKADQKCRTQYGACLYDCDNNYRRAVANQRSAELLVQGCKSDCEKIMQVCFQRAERERVASGGGGQSSCICNGVFKIVQGTCAENGCTQSPLIMK